MKHSVRFGDIFSPRILGLFFCFFCFFLSIERRRYQHWFSRNPSREQSSQSCTYRIDERTFEKIFARHACNLILRAVIYLTYWVVTDIIRRRAWNCVGSFDAGKHNTKWNILNGSDEGSFGSCFGSSFGSREIPSLLWYFCVYSLFFASSRILLRFLRLTEGWCRAQDFLSRIRRRGKVALQSNKKVTTTAKWVTDVAWKLLNVVDLLSMCNAIQRFKGRMCVVSCTHIVLCKLVSQYLPPGVTQSIRKFHYRKSGLSSLVQRTGSLVFSKKVHDEKCLALHFCSHSSCFTASWSDGLLLASLTFASLTFAIQLSISFACYPFKDFSSDKKRHDFLLLRSISLRTILFSIPFCLSILSFRCRLFSSSFFQLKYSCTSRAKKRSAKHVIYRHILDERCVCQRLECLLCASNAGRLFFSFVSWVFLPIPFSNRVPLSSHSSCKLLVCIPGWLQWYVIHVTVNVCLSICVSVRLV